MSRFLALSVAGAVLGVVAAHFSGASGYHQFSSFLSARPDVWIPWGIGGGVVGLLVGYALLKP